MPTNIVKLLQLYIIKPILYYAIYIILSDVIKYGTGPQRTGPSNFRIFAKRTAPGIAARRNKVNDKR